MNRPNRLSLWLALTATLIATGTGIGIGAFWLQHPAFSVGFASIGIPLSVGIWLLAQQQLARATSPHRWDADLQAAQQTIQQLEKTLQEQQTELEQQRQQINALSATIIPIRPGLVVVPLVGPLTRPQVEQLRTSLLQNLNQQNAQVAILDMTGVTALANEAIPLLQQIFAAIELVGCQPILTGLSPQLVRQLLQANLHISSQRNLQAGIAYAEKILE